LHNWQ